MLTERHILIVFRETERGGGRAREREVDSDAREKDRMVANHPHLDWGLGIEPTTQASALIWSGTRTPLVVG